MSFFFEEYTFVAKVLNYDSLFG